MAMLQLLGPVLLVHDPRANRHTLHSHRGCHRRHPVHRSRSLLRKEAHAARNALQITYFASMVNGAGFDFIEARPGHVAECGNVLRV